MYARYAFSAAFYGRPAVDEKWTTSARAVFALRIEHRWNAEGSALAVIVREIYATGCAGRGFC